jgi:hypothetical protein
MLIEDLDAVEGEAFRAALERQVIGSVLSDPTPGWATIVE